MTVIQTVWVAEIFITIQKHSKVFLDLLLIADFFFHWDEFVALNLNLLSGDGDGFTEVNRFSVEI